MKARRKDLRKLYCNQPETRRPHRKIHSPASKMLRSLLKRFLLTLPALWLVFTLVFLMIHIVPGDPVEQMLGEGAAPEQLNQLRHVLGLDLPLHTQYGHYLWQLGHGDFGQSFKFQAPVRQIIFEVTLGLFNSLSWRCCLRGD